MLSKKTVRYYIRIILLTCHASLFYPLERFFLIYWPEEEEDGTVSVHPLEELKGPESSREVGSACVVSFGKKLYTGRIAAFGKYVY